MIFKETGRHGNNAAVWANLVMSTSENPPQEENGINRDEEQRVGENARSLKLLPFEFVALEACLEATCSSLDDEVWISSAAFSISTTFPLMFVKVIH